MFEPPFVTIPLESFRIQLRISILDVDELQNKYQTSAVVTSKKFKVLPPDSSLTLKIVLSLLYRAIKRYLTK
jgi:hypothetical protein